MRVPDAGRRERIGQGIGIELRVGARARHRAHIDEPLDSRLLEQHDQFARRAGRMAYREDRVAHCKVIVTPAKAGSKAAPETRPLDSRFRGNDPTPQYMCWPPLTES